MSARQPGDRRPRMCTRCNGTGVLPQHWNHHGGRCFTCAGSGWLTLERAVETKRMFAARALERKRIRDALDRFNAGP